MNGDPGTIRKPSRRRSNALADYGRRQSGYAGAGDEVPRSRGALLLWLGLTLAAVAVFVLVRPPSLG